MFTCQQRLLYSFSNIHLHSAEQGEDLILVQVEHNHQLEKNNLTKTFHILCIHHQFMQYLINISTCYIAYGCASLNIEKLKARGTIRYEKAV